MIIYVDADACPVKDEVVRVAERYNIPVTMVADGGLRPSLDPMVNNIIVPTGADAADDWIVGHVREGDIVITSDIPLAKRCLEKSACVLGPTGRVFDMANIGMSLAMRDLKQHLREASQSQTYNAAFSKADRSNFLQQLDKSIQQAKTGKLA